MESNAPFQAENSEDVGQHQPNTIVIQLVPIPFNGERQDGPFCVQAIPLYFGPTDPQAGPPQRAVPDRNSRMRPDMAASPGSPPKQMSVQNPIRSARTCCNLCRGQNYSQAQGAPYTSTRGYPMAPGPPPGVRRYPTDDGYNDGRRDSRNTPCCCSCHRNMVPQQEQFEEQVDTLSNSQRERTPVVELGEEGYRDQGTNTTEAATPGNALGGLEALKVICESLGKAMVAATAVAVGAAQKQAIGMEMSPDKSNDETNLSQPKLRASFHKKLIHDYIFPDPADSESVDIPENDPDAVRTVDDEKFIKIEDQADTDSISENKGLNEKLRKINSEDEDVGEETGSIRYLDMPVVEERIEDVEVVSLVSREYPKTPRPTQLYRTTDDIDSGDTSPFPSPTQNKNQDDNELKEVSPPPVVEMPPEPTEDEKLAYPLSASRIIDDPQVDETPHHLSLANDSHSDQAKTNIYPIHRSNGSSMEHFDDPSESERSVQVERIVPLNMTESTVSLFPKNKLDESVPETPQEEENEENSRIASGSSTVQIRRSKIDNSIPIPENTPAVHSSLKSSSSKKYPKKSVSFAHSCADKPSSTGKQKYKKNEPQSGVESAPCHAEMNPKAKNPPSISSNAIKRRPFTDRHFSSKAKRKAGTIGPPIYRCTGPVSWINSTAEFPTSQTSCHTFQYTPVNRPAKQPIPDCQTYAVQYQFNPVDQNM